MSTSITTTTTGNNNPQQQSQQSQQQMNVEQVLQSILELPNESFTVSEYLNTALHDVVTTATLLDNNDNTNSSSNMNDMIHKCTELAVSLQIQTQICHEQIGRISMECDTIIPRCMKDIQRLQTSYNNLQQDCTTLYTQCQSITQQHNTTTSTSTNTTTTTSSSTDRIPTSSGGGGDDSIVNTSLTATTMTPSSDMTVVAMKKNSMTGSSTSTSSSSTINNNTDSMSIMETLSILYALQTYLQRTKEIIIAYNIWDTTIDAISNYIIQHNTMNAVQCLVSLQQCEIILYPMNDIHVQERKDMICKLQHQIIVVLLQPNLIHALSILIPYHPTILVIEVVSSSTTTTTTQSTTNNNSNNKDATSSTSSIDDTTNTLISSSTTPATGISSSSNNNNTNIIPIQQCVQSYQQLHQLHVLIQDYIKSRPIPIHKIWFDTYPIVLTTTTTTTTTNNNNNSHTNEQQVQQQQQNVMVSWIPKWYQEMIQFMNEERRLCEQIFHHSHTNTTTIPSSSNTTTTTTTSIPNILLQMVQECFRPNIISSFISRLHTIYNPTASSSSNSNIVSFPLIVKIYESTIQFLMVLYEIIVNCHMDMVESTSSSSSSAKDNSSGNNTEQQLYQQFIDIMIHIASPFVEYSSSTKYINIESQYIQYMIQSNMKDIQQVITKYISNTEQMSIDILQDTIDKIQSLSCNTLFPILESTLQRYELINGGYYNCNEIIHLIDTMIVQHMNEIVITVHKLSNLIIQNDESTTTFITIFDEQHVYVALHILLLIYEYQQSIHYINNQQIHDRFIRLLNRVQSTITTTTSTNHNNNNNNNPKSKLKFQLSESLSMVEINSILIHTMCCKNTTSTTIGSDVDEQNDFTSTLQQLTTTTKVSTDSNSNTSTTPIYLKMSYEALQQKLLLSCHTFIFDVCFAIPRYHLSSIVSNKSWKISSKNSDNNNEYGILPQEYMTHIGEHMLALVQALEPFAMNQEYLKKVIHVMDSVQRVIQPIWIDVLSVIGNNRGSTKHNHGVLELLMNGAKTELRDYVLGDVPTHDEHHDDNDINDGSNAHDDNDDHTAVTTFCNAWLDVIASAVTGRLIERILRIPLLTNQGCEHLQVDLGYISNVLTALGISGHPHPLLGHIAVLATLDETTLRDRINTMKSNNINNGTMAVDVLCTIEQRFLAVRSFD